MSNDRADRPEAEAAKSFEHSISQLERLRSCDGPRIDSDCCTRLLHHGAPTANALVLLHGFTNCPAQWETVATLAHERGVNVVAPRAPGHGRADREPYELTDLTPALIMEWTQEYILLARGLGRQVTVVGFSFGGVCAGWAARHLDAVDRVVQVAPAYLPFGWPMCCGGLLPTLAKVLPERYLWWDPIRRNQYPGSPNAYKRLSRKGMGAVFELGREVLRAPPARRSRLESAMLVLNEGDVAVSRGAARAYFSAGVEPLAERSEVHVLPLASRYPHDFIDPSGPNSENSADAAEWLLDIIG